MVSFVWMYDCIFYFLLFFFCHLLFYKPKLKYEDSVAPSWGPGLRAFQNYNTLDFIWVLRALGYQTNRCFWWSFTKNTTTRNLFFLVLFFILIDYWSNPPDHGYQGYFFYFMLNFIKINLMGAIFKFLKKKKENLNWTPMKAKNKFS